MVDLGKDQNELYIIVYSITIYWDLIYISRISNVYSCKREVQQELLYFFLYMTLALSKETMGKNQPFLCFPKDIYSFNGKMIYFK